MPRLLVAPALVLILLAAAASAAASTVRLSRCDMVVDLFDAPRPEVRAIVPRRYALQPWHVGKGRAAVDVWTFDCRRVTVGTTSAAGVLTIAGAVVYDPRSSRHKRATPSHFHHYVLSAHSDHQRLAAVLASAGLPVVFDAGVGVRAGRLEVPGGDGFTLTSRHRHVFRDQPHDHANGWWFDGRDGRGGVTMRARHANDDVCDGACALLRPHAGSLLADILGADARSTVRFDHLELSPTLVTHAP